MLETAEKLRKARSDKVDEWISANLVIPYTRILDSITQSGKSLTKSVGEIGGTFSLSSARQLSTYQNFITLVDSRVSAVIDATVSQLNVDGQEFHDAGTVDAAIIASLQVEFNNYSADQITKLILDGIIPAPYELLSGEVSNRFSTTSGAIIATLEEKIDRKIALSRQAEPNLSPIIADVLGQGLLWLSNMANMSLWGTYQGGIFRVVNSYPWLTNWMWVAQLDRRACISCIALHGTIHPPHEELHDHPNGRCLAVPLAGGGLPISLVDRGGLIVASGKVLTPTVTTGVDWLSKQSASTQIQIMGPKAYQAWQDGKVSIPDLSVAQEHPLYGTIMRRGSIKEVIGE